MTPAQKKVLTMLRKRKSKGITGQDFEPTFNYNTRLSELRRMKSNGKPRFVIYRARESATNPLYRHWLILETGNG